MMSGIRICLFFSVFVGFGINLAYRNICIRPYMLMGIYIFIFLVFGLAADKAHPLGIAFNFHSGIIFVSRIVVGCISAPHMFFRFCRFNRTENT